MATKIELVRVNGVCYPMSSADIESLSAAGYPMCRISQTALDAIRAMFKKSDLEFEVYPWEATHPELIRHFISMCDQEPDLAGKVTLDPAYDPVKPSFRVFVQEQEHAEPAIPSIEEIARTRLARKPQRQPIAVQDLSKALAAAKVEQEQLVASHAFETRLLPRLQRYVGQYCFRLVHTKASKPHDGGTLHQVDFRYEPDMPNHTFYASAPDIKSEAYLQLGMYYRLRFEMKTMELDGKFKRVLSIAAQEHINGSWQGPMLPRVFPVRDVDHASAKDLVTFIMGNLL